MSDWKLIFLQPTGDDFFQWKSLVNRFHPENMDIHYIPEYALIYKLTFGQDILLSFFGDHDNFIIAPFMRTNLNLLPFMKDNLDQPDFYDIESLYGYGGPLAYLSGNNEGVRRELFSEFYNTFHEHCLKNNIVDEYIRYHPLLKNYNPVQRFNHVDLTFVKPVIYIDLLQSETDLWKGVCRGHRSSINKARSIGVTIERRRPDDEGLNTFQEIYNETMKRNKANSQWYLPPNYFRNCVKCLTESHTSLFNAMYGGQIIASYLILHGFQTAYYHFGGSREEDFKLRANNLLIYEIAIWAKKKGYKWFHLGGGIHPNDGVYRFKAGFSKKQTGLYSSNNIHNQKKYNQICAIKKSWDFSHHIKSIQTNFFPAYKG